VAGYLIAVIAFGLALFFGTIRAVRPRVVLAVGGILAFGWAVALAAGRAQDAQGHQVVLPLWFVAGLVAMLYAIWCGGLWLGLRIRRARTHT
jgi:branched-subunit amino acid ABC-type transport system permease component